MSSAQAHTSRLWHSIAAGGLRTVAVLGMSKNTGKTVALNHLLAQAAAAGVSVGVSSIGRDGEAQDQVYGVPKPPVLVWPGNLVATARATLQRASVHTRFLAGTGIDSPMGEIVLVQVQAYGAMEIAGASCSSAQRAVIAQLQQCGAALVLLDGALGRSQHASPAIADGVILSTGAALGGGMADVLRKTRDRLELLSLPAADAKTQARCQSVMAQGGVAVWSRSGEVLFQQNIATLTAGAQLLQLRRADVGLIAVSGAVGRALWRALTELALHHPDLELVVHDGSKLFIQQAELRALQHLGTRIWAFAPIRLVGIAVNPFSPLGGSFNAADFLHAARSAFDGYAVSDVMLEPSPPATGVLG